MIVPALLAAGLLLAYLAFLVSRNAAPGWILPALGAAGLTLWSLLAITRGGPFGFWVEHTRNAWGVQIWIDLLLAIAVALTALVPAARAEGMRVVPWLLLVLATGSIGVCAMAARLSWLRARRAAQPA
ncbi:hypothetical protein [uncultured Jannaschia sp.]|uniref:hypothetical protein n=1 Tax=uncultured Jannaschia sp. TaxID=293347 RepID=UPI002605882A|nr:hypothetical protein [uncultured Jannaschia sp.]